MKFLAYYNEIDPFCCDWLSNLMDAGAITPGYIDNRSIEDVTPDDLSGYVRVGFFAGIGVWDYALRLAGWPAGKPVWHGSCPCQPFSAAGKGAGFADERHLWPAFFHLIEQCRPAIVFGEQVASKAVEPWIDTLQVDLEAVGYAFGCVPFPASSVGAPHIRDRAYWVADTEGQQCSRKMRLQGDEFNIVREGIEAGRCLHLGGLVHTDGDGCNQREQTGQTTGHRGSAIATSCGDRPRPTNGFWRDVDWIFCRDGKWRPVEPGTFPLVNGATQRVVCACTECETETVIYEGMYFLRKIVDRNKGRLEEEVLRQRVLSFARAINAVNQQKHGALQSERTEAEGMRNMPFDIESACSPQGQKPTERPSGEPANFMLEMPSQNTLHESALYVRSVRKDIQSGIAPKQEQNMFCPVCERVGAHICTKEVSKNRVGRLRGYGNAINAEEAKAFITAFMEAA